MPDKKLTDSEIVKALEEAIEYGCGHYVEIELSTIKDVLDLINRLQADNERLQKVSDIRLECLGRSRAKAKAEAYKECIEKVEEKSTKLNMCHNDIVVKTDYQISGEALDDILKELVGE